MNKQAIKTVCLKNMYLHNREYIKNSYKLNTKHTTQFFFNKQKNQLTKEDGQTASEHIKMCSTLLYIRVMQTKMTVTFPHTFIKMAEIK